MNAVGQRGRCGKKACAETIGENATVYYARLLYTYIHLVVVAGLIVSAVGDELLLGQPRGHPSGEQLAASLGGALLFLLGNILLKGVARGRPPLSHLGGMLALMAVAALAVADTDLSLLSINVMANAVLCIVAAWETWSVRLEGTPDQG